MAHIRPKKRKSRAGRDLESEGARQEAPGLARYRRELCAAGFQIVEPVRSFGYFAWKPGWSSSAASDGAAPEDLPESSYRRLADLTSAAEVLDQIDWRGRPRRVVEDAAAVPIPENFPAPAGPSRHRNQYPFGQSDVAAMCVAGRRGLDLDGVDFVLGGSVLGMLAARTTLDHETLSEVFYCARVPSLARAVMVARRKNYVQDRSLAGFQFERLATGQPVDCPDGTLATYFHVHLARIGPHRVLISRETDAVAAGDADENLDPVEIKANNPQRWSLATVFQLVSGACAAVVHGDRRTRRIQVISLSALASGVAAASGKTRQALIQEAEQNVLRGLAELRAAAPALREGAEYRVQIDASTDELRAVPVPDDVRASEPWTALLPPAGVVRQLLAQTWASPPPAVERLDSADLASAGDFRGGSAGPDARGRAPEA